MDAGMPGTPFETYQIVATHAAARLHRHALRHDACWFDARMDSARGRQVSSSGLEHFRSDPLANCAMDRKERLLKIRSWCWLAEVLRRFVAVHDRVMARTAVPCLAMVMPGLSRGLSVTLHRQTAGWRRLLAGYACAHA